MTLRNATVALLLAGALAVPAFAQEDKAKIDRGIKVFADKRCSMCHSIAGKGNKTAPLDGVGDRLTPEQIRTYIVSPKKVKADSKMKAYPDLPAEDLDALVAYLSSLTAKK